MKEGCCDLPEEVPEDCLDDIPPHEDEDVLVLDGAQSNGTGELVDEAKQANDNTRGGKTLGTPVGVECLGWDYALQRGIGEGVDGVEEEVEGESGLAVHDIVGVELVVDGVLRDAGGGAAVDGKQDGADKGADDQDLAPGHLVAEDDADAGPDGGEAAVQDVEAELLGRARDADALEDGGVEVSQAVP